VHVRIITCHKSKVRSVDFSKVFSKPRAFNCQKSDDMLNAFNRGWD